jgi:two-component system, OmpR family, phosphate regulon response regulator PhoB
VVSLQVLMTIWPEAVAEELRAGELALNRSSKRVMRGPRDIDLSPTEFRLLEQLMRNPGRVYSRAQLLDIVWGQDSEVDERTVDVHVGRLRKMLNRGKDVDPIRTVRSGGYSFNERFGS